MSDRLPGRLQAFLGVDPDSKPNEGYALATKRTYPRGSPSTSPVPTMRSWRPSTSASAATPRSGCTALRGSSRNHRPRSTYRTRSTRRRSGTSGWGARGPAPVSAPTTGAGPWLPGRRGRTSRVTQAYSRPFMISSALAGIEVPVRLRALEHPPPVAETRTGSCWASTARPATRRTSSPSGLSASHTRLAEVHPEGVLRGRPRGY